MNILKNIIERLNQKLDASNIFGSIYGLAEQAPDDPKKLYVYIGSGQGELVTDYDKTQGTAFWRLRSAVTMRQTEVLRPIGCQEMYIATYPLRCYAYVKKNSLPCDSNAVEGWVMDMFWKYVAGKDTELRTNLGVTDIFFRPVSTTPNTPDLPANFEWVHLYFDLDVEVTAKAIESCYDECGVNPIPLPNGQCPPINRVQSVTGLDTDNTDPSNPIVRISVDGSTITGSGTPDDPLVAIGGGGGGSNLRVQDEGTTVTNAATTLNFTGNVTASLASAGNVTVNVPAPTPQVNSDWNAVSGVAEILNKPTIPAAQIQSDWNQANNAAVDFIKNKPTIPSITGLVPYTGATADVDLGANGLDAEFVRVTGTNGVGDIHLRHQATDATATGQSTSIFADANGDIKIKNDGLDYATLKTSLITDDRIYTFPDKSGTVAMTSDVEVYTEGTGIDITSNVITNTAPDQTVVLNEGTGIDVTGTYPNFTIANTAPDQTVVLTAGTGIGISGTYPNFTITNSRPAYILFKNVDNQTAVTGNTNNNLVLGVSIPANTIAVGSIVNIKARVGKTGGAGITTLRIYANTANSIVSPAPTLLMTSATASIGQVYNGMDRNAIVKTTTNTQTAQANASIQTDATVGNATLTNSNIDWTVDQFLIFAIQNGANGDSTVLSYIEIEIK